MLRVLLILSLLLTGVGSMAQAPGVKIVRDRGQPFDILVEQANNLRDEGKLLSIQAVTAQLARATCALKLPGPASKPLTVREIWQRSRDAHVRVGWHYLCTRCDKWHQNLAGGYFITSDGAIATSYHVLSPAPDLREGYLVAANEDDELLVVTEILAGNELTDSAIVRAQTRSRVRPLPLNTRVHPGDSAWCYSDPLGRSSYFSQGMVNRFYVQQRRGKESTRIEVSTDWAPGSSGAAVLDQSGNAIGHVSEISGGTPRPQGSNQVSSINSMILFHSATRAADVLSLITPQKRSRK